MAHRETLDAIGSAAFARQSCAALADRLHQAGIASGCVGSMDDLATHPPNRFVEVETLTGPVKLLAPGALLDGQLPVYGPVPELGKHSQTIRAEFSDDYHRNNGRNRTYPVKSIEALTKGGWLSAMIPEKFGGSGLGLTKASIVMEGTNRCGCNAGHCHGQMYNVGTLLRYGSAEQKFRYLPSIASGALRLQSMA